MPVYAMRRGDGIRDMIAKEAARIMYEEGVVVECFVCPLQDIRRIRKSGITGMPMERADTKRLT